MNNQTLKVFIPDHKTLNDPEILAMLQAFYSRSGMDIESRLHDLNDGDTELVEARIKKAINTYVIGYGHASIADCANVPVFVENVSMLAAKALQDNPLYNGQERSTRYQDFSEVPIYTETALSAMVAAEWRSLYLAYLPKIEAWVVAEYKDQKDALTGGPLPTVWESPDHYKAALAKREASYLKTCKAIAFDIARGLLACGSTTSLSMYMSLRQYRDHITSLSRHPLAEVRNIALKLNEELFARYPNTFRPINVTTASEINHAFYMARKVYDTSSHASVADKVELGTTGQYLANDGDNTWYGIQGALDFGSFRDLQRHRNGKNQMPLVNATLGPINSYYHKILKRVDAELFQRVLDNYDRLLAATDLNSDSVFELQYAHPMMTQVPVGLFWSKSQLKYVLELRTKTSVHPTLREMCYHLWNTLSHSDAKDISIDTRLHYHQSNRGDQDITKKEVP